MRRTSSESSRPAACPCAAPPVIVALRIGGARCWPFSRPGATGNSSERDHLVPVVDEPPHAGVALVLARELDALRDHRVLHAECARAVGADPGDPIADRRVEPVRLVLLLRELRDPRRPRAVEDDADLVVPFLQLLGCLER